MDREKMSAGPRQSAYKEEEEIVVISDSSDDEKTSIKSQGRKRRQVTPSSEKSTPAGIEEEKKEDMEGKKRAKKRHMEEEEIIVISDSSDDEKKTSIKSQGKKRRRVTSSSEKSTPAGIEEAKKEEDMKGKRRAKKRHIEDSTVEEQQPPIKVPRGEDREEDQAGSGGHSGVRPTGSAGTISDTISKRLQFHHVLGKGSYGKVVLAVDTVTSRQYAVKILKKRALLDEGDEADVLVEHRVLQLASGSPFLVHAHFAFQTKMLVLLGLEFMSCGDFDKLLSKGPLDIPSATFYAAELVCGIQYLHSKGIIHRDLKPENILVAETGHLKITDFGLALENMLGDRTATEYAGTTGYVAPEVLAEEEYNAGADWYSFGVIMNKMITGQCRYHPRHFNLSSGTENIISQLLQSDPDQRLGVNGKIREHQFFQRIDWVSVEALRMPPPHIPIPSKPGRHSKKFHLNTMEAAEAKKSRLSAEDQAVFRGFSFVISKTFG